MCQAYDGERNYLVHQEIAEIRAKWEQHVSGEVPLTDSEIEDLCVRKIMLDEM